MTVQLEYNLQMMTILLEYIDKFSLRTLLFVLKLGGMAPLDPQEPAYVYVCL